MKRILWLITLIFLILVLVSFSFALCGNGVLDSDEQCDGANFGLMTCEKLDKGYIGGKLTCNSDCTINSVSCYSDTNQIATFPPAFYCGDGIKQASEQCDGLDFGNKTCETIGYASGALLCNSRCVIDVTNCKTQAEVAEQNDLNNSSNTEDNALMGKVGEIIGSEQFLLILIVIIIALISIGVSKILAKNEEIERKEIISKIRNK